MPKNILLSCYKNYVITIENSKNKIHFIIMFIMSFQYFLCIIGMYVYVYMYVYTERVYLTYT